jgi:hypothetical protein
MPRLPQLRFGFTKQGKPTAFFTRSVSSAAGGIYSSAETVAPLAEKLQQLIAK